MSIIAWIVLGLIAGLIAEKVTGERTGWVVAGIAGIAGALLGGWLAKMIFHVHSLDTFFNVSTWITAIVGAVIVLLAVRLITSATGHSLRGRRHTTSHH
ncbi:GlsB/YeaQ/YmgE family stress response membrane protein [Frankia sp. AiPs1]|uniref:GlsB/YeaQ/YmgE family stress response membrane protein n=1 Tax=Frankia sp. AiPa1 TaxID=573492 RepID=UPI00202B554C|nr:GlsB/YeaQ/YmgE family stress response membrane protein [Frankia sp. AiPa1]MCL9759649.1 GlsB/YeaQ/YmgE family stress response membrane protein [Frankia sp. AiPa1]